MILGFTQRFPWGNNTGFQDKIIDGIKKHSFRIDSHKRWKSGIKIQFATGVRSKRYNNFSDGECKCIQHVVIEEYCLANDNHSFLFIPSNSSHIQQKKFRVIIDNRILHWTEIVKLSRNDGFDSPEDFFRWFYNGFDGFIIHWTDLKY